MQQDRNEEQKFSSYLLIFLSSFLLPHMPHAEHGGHHHAQWLWNSRQCSWDSMQALSPSGLVRVCVCLSMVLYPLNMCLLDSMPLSCFHLKLSCCPLCYHVILGPSFPPSTPSHLTHPHVFMFVDIDLRYPHVASQQQDRTCASTGC